MSANILLTCSVCNAQNVVPRIHPNMLARDGVMTACRTCGNVTSQRVTGTAPGISGTVAAAPLSAASPQRPGAAGSATTGSSGASNGGGFAGLTAADNDLWAALLAGLGAKGLQADDILRSDDATRRRLVEAAGFVGPQQQRLVELARAFSALAGVGVAVGPFGVSVAAPAANGGAGGDAGAAGFFQRGLAAGAGDPFGTTAATAAGAFGSPARTAAPTDGGGPILARCSVYPHLPAEFWCCACGVLVSSRCHVQGVHKDHPFVSLRMAAEAHVRDMSGWAERCRGQLAVTSSVTANLRHAEQLLHAQGAQQAEALDDAAAQLVQDLLRWKERLKADIGAAVVAQIVGIQHARRQTEVLHAVFAQQLAACEPLLGTVPPVEQADRAADEWALRVMDFVAQLKTVSAEPIPMPRLVMPRVVCNATPATHMDLLTTVAQPLGVRLPDLVDPGYFNFPHPSASARLPFTLDAGDDAASRGVLVHNGRTLTRAQDVVPSHVLVCASQVLYSGVSTWEVHVDRVGSGPGRVLAGIVVHGTDGEGVVWDGARIVGPNEGECRTVDERCAVRAGTVLRFHLELEPPSCFLTCFFDRDVVARVPLPPTGNGWLPAFSVFGPQDQITVVATAQTQRLPKDAAVPGRAATTDATLERQEHALAALQQQIHAVRTRLDTDEYSRLLRDASPPPPTPGSAASPPRVASSGGYSGLLGTPAYGASAAATSPVPAPGPASLFGRSGGASTLSSVPGASLATAAQPPRAQGTPTAAALAPPPASTTPVASGLSSSEVYSPELKQLMRFVGEVKP